MLTADLELLDIQPGDLVLDAGCGTGRHACQISKTLSAQVVGIDLNREDLRKTAFILGSLEGDRSWMVLQADVTNIPFKDNLFDLIICSEVLEHIPENRMAAAELIRVLKPGKDIVVSVPRFLPERICWALSSDYHNEPGGHIRIYTKRGLLSLLEHAGVRCWKIRYKHALHSPYWWLKCIVGHKNETSWFVNLYKRFLEWDIMRHPLLIRALDKLLNPLIGKSMVLYLRKD
jgi:ubiquinone/menaquinone biosynthesis C-methylase UbiE